MLMGIGMVRMSPMIREVNIADGPALCVKFPSLVVLSCTAFLLAELGMRSLSFRIGLGVSSFIPRQLPIRKVGAFRFRCCFRFPGLTGLLRVGACVHDYPKGQPETLPNLRSS